MKTLNFLQASACMAVLALMSFGPPTTVGQQIGTGLSQQTFVDASIQQVEVVVGASRRLKFGYKIPELLVENPEVVKATPVAPTEILISGLKPGLTTITVSDPEKNLQSLVVHVMADTRKLEAALRRHFPDSNVQVHALQTGVMLQGTVSRADHVNTIMSIAQDYFPTNVINQMQVDGSQLVAIKVKVYEVNRTKLRAVGIDWAVFGQEFAFVSSIADLIQAAGSSAGSFNTPDAATISFGVFGADVELFGFLELLEQNNLAKLLDQPTLVAQNGRPAEFLSGGEIPIAVAAGLGTNAIEFRPFGTKLDMVPIIHGMGELSLEVRAEVSEVDNSLSFGSGVPGFRVRRVNTGVRMREGHTLALAGDYRELTLNEKRGIPFLMDSPIIGPLFRRTEERKAESELVFLITPRFVSDVDPTCVPRYGPGQLTESPSDHEFYWNAYNEVPRCNDDCPVNDRFEDPANYGNYRDYPASLEEIKQRKPVETPAGNYAPAQMPEDGMSRNRQGGGMLRGQPIEQPVRYPLPDGGSFSSPVGGGGSPDWPQRN